MFNLFTTPAFDYSWVLWALPLAPLPLLAFFLRPASRSSAVAFSLVDSAAFPLTLRQRLGWLPELTRCVALALLILAAAGPHWGAVRMTDETRGIAIELVVDRSSSMSLEDMDYGPSLERLHLKSQRESRLTVVKAISKEFLLGNGSDLKGRSGDAIGLVAFASHAQNLSPLVSHNEAGLARSVDSIDFARGKEDETAIGDAVALAASRIRLTEEARAISFRSKIIILLTDGQENAGNRRLGDAARIAARWNVRVYAVGIRPMPEGGDREDEIGYGLDTLASTTNGMSAMARDAAAMHRFFAAIDRLEPNEIPATGMNGGFHPTTILLLLAFAAICGEAGLRQGWMRVAP